MLPTSCITEESLDHQGTTVITFGYRGIGLALTYALTHALAQAGSNVALLYKASQKAPEVADEIQKKFPKVTVRAFECDECNIDNLGEILRKIREQLGPISGFIANTDTSVVKPALELSYDEFQKVFDVNVFATFNSSRAVAQHWINNNEGGSIVIISSMSAQIINQAGRNKALTQAFYNSSKAATRHLSRALAAEWAEKRIRVNSVSPGYVVTEETEGIDKKILEHQQENVPLRRFAQPKEISGQVLLLLSKHASYMTGGDYPVEGGQLVW